VSYGEGDWVVEIDTGRVGILRRKNWCEVSVRFGKAVALRYPEQVELAPLDIREDDIAAMIDLALATNDEEWFMDLTGRINYYRRYAV
jgi:hypothetical protein